MRPSVYLAFFVAVTAGEESLLDSCGRVSELGTCLRVRAVALLDRALHSGPIRIDDRISLVPEPAAREQLRSGRALTEDELKASLPENPDEKEQSLDDLIVDKFLAIMKTRSINLRLLDDDELGGAEEGRKKDKKGYGMMAAAGMFISMMVKVALAKLALIAGKALIVSKMALLLSGIIGLKKLVGGGGESHQVVYATGGHDGGGHGDWGRSEKRIPYSAQARSAKY